MSKFRLFLSLGLALGVLVGCSASPTAADRKMATFSQWQKDAATREGRGELSRIDKLQEMYAQLAKEPVSRTDVAGMQWASSDIATLEAFRVGKIDRSEAENRLRQSETAWRSSMADQDAAGKSVSTRCVTWQGITQCSTR